MKYTLVNRKKTVNAKSNEEFVRWMRKSDLQFFQTNNEFMEAYAHRKMTFEKIKLNAENENTFVEDLKSNNLLIIEEKESFWNLFKK